MLTTLTKIYSYSTHAAYVLLLVLHTCRLHICAAYEHMHAACGQEGTNWSCVHQDFLHMCSTHLLVCGYVSLECSTHLLVCGYVSLECSTLEFGQKMRATCVQHCCKGSAPVSRTDVIPFMVIASRSAKQLYYQ